LKSSNTGRVRKERFLCPLLLVELGGKGLLNYFSSSGRVGKIGLNPLVVSIIPVDNGLLSSYSGRVGSKDVLSSILAGSEG
jgi:hypothetical protein